MRHVAGIDAGGSKTRGLLADETGKVVADAQVGGANLRIHGELEVEKVLHSLLERLASEARAMPDALALGIAGADRPDDEAVLRGILSRIGFGRRVVVSNDARIAFVAGSRSQVGLALVCGTGSIAWGRNVRGEVARAGGWGWHVGDEGSGFWIGERAIRQVLRAHDGREGPTSLGERLREHFHLDRIERIVHAVYDREYPRSEVAAFALRVEEEARAGDSVAREILAAAADELELAARTVVARLGLSGGAYDVVLSGGTFRALPGLTVEVRKRLADPGVTIGLIGCEPALGAVRLALEALDPPA